MLGDGRHTEGVQYVTAVGVWRRLFRNSLAIRTLSCSLQDALSRLKGGLLRQSPGAAASRAATLHLGRGPYAPLPPPFLPPFGLPVPASGAIPPPPRAPGS